MDKSKPKLFCRKATLKDINLFYDWLNDSEVRKNSLSKKKNITWNSHKAWFKKKIKNKKAIFYIFSTTDSDIGQVRFEIKNKITTISYLICKSFRGKKLSKIMLSQAIKRYKPKKGTALLGKVKKRNFPSIKVFKSLGFDFKLFKFYYFKKNY